MTAPQPLLAGITVVDMTQYLSGPTTTRLMAELGAEVIKIEQPPGGDPSRALAMISNGRSGYFVQQNRGKKSVCLDFNDPAAREALIALIGQADVFVENYGPNVLEKRGLGYDALHERFPRLIYASISGFGRKGVFSHKTSFDLIAQAHSGLIHLTGDPDGAPMPVGTSYADVMTGVHTYAAIATALFHRERTGRGQNIDIAMVDSLFHANEISVQGVSITKGKWRLKRGGRLASSNAPQGVYKGPQGWIVMQVMDNQWPGFCKAMERPDLIEHEVFGNLRGRAKNRVELNEIIEQWTVSFPDDASLIARLEEFRVPCSPVIDPAESINHPYFRERRMVKTITDPLGGEFEIAGMPLKFSDMPEDLEFDAPALGEHNTEILRRAGLSDDAITALEESGALRQNLAV